VEALHPCASALKPEEWSRSPMCGTGAQDRWLRSRVATERQRFYLATTKMLLLK
jgi:hypothetical protein